jgi:Ca2+-binding RTX toxin-like protein
VAKKITGTKRSELIVGTKRADRIKGKGGNDLIKGKGGSDRLNGGKGSNKVVGGKGNDKVIGGPQGDTLIGGSGVDSLVGARGNDLLKAADGRRDRVIDAGPGTNKCIVDTVELSIVRGCGSVQATRPGGQGGTGGGTGGGGGGGGGPGSGQGLQYNDVTVNCDPLALGLCSFVISGTGADAPIGTVEDAVSDDDVTNVFGVALAPGGPDWTATGGYQCTGPGSVRVIIGSESVDVPVTCGS